MDDDRLVVPQTTEILWFDIFRTVALVQMDVGWGFRKRAFASVAAVIDDDPKPIPDGPPIDEQPRVSKFLGRPMSSRAAADQVGT